MKHTCNSPMLHMDTGHSTCRIRESKSREFTTEINSTAYAYEGSGISGRLVHDQRGRLKRVLFPGGKTQLHQLTVHKHWRLENKSDTQITVEQDIPHRVPAPYHYYTYNLQRRTVLFNKGHLWDQPFRPL